MQSPKDVDPGRRNRFPLGAGLRLEELEQDPYPVYERLRLGEPISWIEPLQMYFAVRYEDVAHILNDPDHFRVGTPSSTLYDTFGEHLLTVEGERHAGFKSAFLPAFQPAAVRSALEGTVRARARDLLAGHHPGEPLEVRENFAARLPVLTMLALFGLADEHEADLRRWYDAFARALANFTWREDIRRQARSCTTEFMALLRAQWLGPGGRVSAGRRSAAALAADAFSGSMDEEALLRNALIIFFGGISTVEATILNAVYALALHPQVQEQVRADATRIPALIEETVRWGGSVQSATRHVTRTIRLGEVEFHPGDTVNAMIAAANRDPAVFSAPDRFDPGRRGLRRHLGFAAGPHHCLGSQLARLEIRLALEALLAHRAWFELVDAAQAHPLGSEFRQPQILMLAAAQ